MSRPPCLYVHTTLPRHTPSLLDLSPGCPEIAANKQTIGAPIRSNISHQKLPSSHTHSSGLPIATVLVAPGGEVSGHGHHHGPRAKRLLPPARTSVRGGGNSGLVVVAVVVAVVLAVVLAVVVAGGGRSTILSQPVQIW